MRLSNGLEFQWEDDCLWIIWFGKDHVKLYKNDWKKLFKWMLKRATVGR
jgi:hypothetical protein